MVRNDERDDWLPAIVTGVITSLRRRLGAAPREIIEDAVADVMEKWPREAPSEIRADKLRSRNWILLRARSHLRNILARELRLDALTPCAAVEQRVRVSPHEAVDARLDIERWMNELKESSFEQFVAIVFYNQFEMPMESVASALDCLRNEAYHIHEQAIRSLHLIATGAWRPKANAPKTKRRRKRKE